MIDVTAATVEKASAFHWQVAQATSLDSVWVYASKAPGTTQLGMFSENGSGGFMSNCYFEGGNYGICKFSADISVLLLFKANG
jgi:hypothetical protein